MATAFAFTGTTIDGISADVTVTVLSASGVTAREFDAWTRTINRCNQFANRAFNKPGKFDVAVTLSGADTASDGGDIRLVVNDLPVGAGLESLDCEVSKDSQAP